MKKSFIVILFIAFLVTGIFSGCSVPSVSYNKEALVENVRAYNKFAEFCQQCYDSNDIYYSYYYNANNNTLFCNATDRSYQMNKEQAESAQTVKNTLLIGEQTLENIYVSKNYVSLSTVELRGSFIYSIDNTEPDFVCFPTEDKEKIFVEKIAENWYFACKQG